MTSDPQLRRWYLDFNRRYFAGELPTDTVTVFWEPIGGALALCSEVENSGGELQIRVNPALRLVGSRPRYSAAKLALLHEMVHVKWWTHRVEHHGRRFDEELQRLCQYRSFRNLL